VTRDERTDPSPARSGEEAFDFSLAGTADEPEIRRLVGATPMPGAVAIRFEREPDYFLGCSIMGDPCDVLIARHLPDGELAGMLCRAERAAFVNGRETRIGYIGQIRAADRYRGRWLLQRGLPLFRHHSPPGMLYFGVMARENPRARGVLIERRPPGGLHAARLSGWTTYAIVLRRRRGGRAGSSARPNRRDGLAIERGSVDRLEEIVAFLRRVGAGRQLYPAYREEDFLDGRRMRGLAVDDIAVARRGGAIVGVMGMWDQSGFKQDVIDDLGPRLRRFRPAYDLAARLIGARPLPREGEVLRSAFASFVAVEGDDFAVMRALLRDTCDRACALGHTYVTLGLADADPLLAAARRTFHITYRSDLFLLSWDAPDPAAGLDGRVPYIEIATL
jgi:hypothetical protein